MSDTGCDWVDRPIVGCVNTGAGVYKILVALGTVSQSLLVFAGHKLSSLSLKCKERAVDYSNFMGGF